MVAKNYLCNSHRTWPSHKNIKPFYNSLYDSYDTEFEKIINKELGKITLWLKLNKLSLNVAKSNFVVFHQPKKKIFIPTIQREDTKINCAKIVTFLGFKIN